MPLLYGRSSNSINSILVTFSPSTLNLNTSGALIILSNRILPLYSYFNLISSTLINLQYLSK